MKIQKFNEAYVDDLHDITFNKSKSFTPEINTFIDDFHSSCDDGIIGFVDTTASSFNIKLKEYKDIFNNNTKLLKLAEMKDLKNLKEYALLKNEIVEVENRIDELLKIKNKIETKSYNELIIKYQEDLITDDFNSFYEIFLKDELDFDDSDNIYGDIHPTIIKKYKKRIDEFVAIHSTSKKYNL